MWSDQPGNKAGCLVHYVSDLGRWIYDTNNGFGGGGLFYWCIILLINVHLLGCNSINDRIGCHIIYLNISHQIPQYLYCHNIVATNVYFPHFYQRHTNSPFIVRCIGAMGKVASLVNVVSPHQMNEVRLY